MKRLNRKYRKALNLLEGGEVVIQFPFWGNVYMLGSLEVPGDWVTRWIHRGMIQPCTHLAMSWEAATSRPLPLGVILSHIVLFLGVADEHPSKRFLVTEIGCGLAGYSAKEIGELFGMCNVPANVILPESFAQQSSDDQP